MSYNVLTIPPFTKQLKRLLKDYPSFSDDFESFITSLEAGLIQGKSLGKNCYKIRVAISAKSKGKSGGARVIINITVSNDIIYLLTIYDKSDKTSLTDKELNELLSFIED